MAPAIHKLKDNSHHLNLYNIFREKLVINSDGSWPKFTWIKRECDFTFHNLQETWNPSMGIFHILHNSEWSISKIWIILREITKIMGNACERDFIIWNWNETWSCEMLYIAFEQKFSVNVNSVTHHMSLIFYALDRLLKLETLYVSLSLHTYDHKNPTGL